MLNATDWRVFEDAGHAYRFDGRGRRLDVYLTDNWTWRAEVNGCGITECATMRDAMQRAEAESAHLDALRATRLPTPPRD